MSLDEDEKTDFIGLNAADAVAQSMLTLGIGRQRNTPETF